MSNWNGAVFTFAGAVEHHAGMKISGEKRDPLTTDELKIISSKFPKEDIKLIEIGKEYGIKDASVLFIKNGLKTITNCDSNKLWDNVKNLGLNGVDTKALMRGRVVNKKARYNFNVMDTEEVADYKSGVGTTYKFTKFPNLVVIRDFMSSLLKRLENLNAEANIYHSVDSGIGFHGDTERGIVIGINLGKERKIEWQVFEKFLPKGERITITLNHGDIYFMTGNAAGINWKKSSIPTIRHRAGYAKWLERDEKQNQKKWEKRIK